MTFETDTNPTRFLDPPEQRVKPRRSKRCSKCGRPGKFMFTRTCHGGFHHFPVVGR